jgi:hypothetical protein
LEVLSSYYSIYLGLLLGFLKLKTYILFISLSLHYLIHIHLCFLPLNTSLVEGFIKRKHTVPKINRITSKPGYDKETHKVNPKKITKKGKINIKIM